MRAVLIPSILAAITACSQGVSPPAGRMIAPVLSEAEARDIHSHAEPQVARVTHVDLDLVADFDTSTLSGTATLDVQAAGPEAVLTLDIRNLHIAAVTDEKGRPLEWSTVARPDGTLAELGNALRITLHAARRVKVAYRTDAGAQALQWLAPAQTAGGRHPYLFTQGQAILTRTWIPTQDSPGIRQTWTARIVAPKALTVVMSAESLGHEDVGDSARAWRFRMDRPIAPYLIAMAIGDIAFHELGPRTGVYAEPSRLDAAAAEFADLERMLRAVEELYGEYRWGRYDVLVLPPSFPFGGMENPRLTFATPTIIAGDKSLVGLIAHELAHSWSGNLVTNATWSDFWLNEGFTVYIEDRIMEAVYGRRFSAMLADLGWDQLQEELARLGGNAGADTRLHLNLSGRTPDDGLTTIAYEKGAAFLRTIEATVGRERWDAWLRSYFDRHAFRPQTSRGFLADLRQHLIADDAELEARLALEEWVFGMGLPANVVHIPAEAFRAIDAAAEAFAAKGALPDVSAWSSAERVRFLERLPRRQTAARLNALARHLHLETQQNSEVRFAWLSLAIANRHPPAEAQVEEFLTSQGRRKFVLPLYKALMEQGSWGEAIARRVYARARPGYHAVTTGSVDGVMGPARAGD